MPRHAEPIRKVTRYGCGCWRRNEPERCPTQDDKPVAPALSRWEVVADTGSRGSAKRQQERKRFPTRKAAVAWLSTTRAAVDAARTSGALD